MRDILFRGKKKDKGEWIEGNGIDCNFSSVAILAGDYDYSTGACIVDDYEVDPSTVGQFTGLTDKNGNKIFEGDILKIAKASDGTGHYYIPPLDYPVKVVVKWDMCAWMWETLCEDKRYIGFPDAWCHYVCEVIGNIHDNSELLENH